MAPEAPGSGLERVLPPYNWSTWFEIFKTMWRYWDGKEAIFRRGCIEPAGQVELSLASGSSVETACRSAGISDATYYNWRKRYGGMGKSQLQEFKSLGKENSRLKMIVADLELDKLILKESLDYLKGISKNTFPRFHGLESC